MSVQKGDADDHADFFQFGGDTDNNILYLYHAVDSDYQVWNTPGNSAYTMDNFAIVACYFEKRSSNHWVGNFSQDGVPRLAFDRGQRG